MSLTGPEIEQLRPLLKNVSIFEHLEPQELDEVARALDKVPLRKGDSVIRQGETGDAFFLIGSGSVGVFREPSDGATRARLNSLGAGGFFGEIALLFDVKRTATVIGESDGELYRMSRENFERMLLANRLVGDIIRVTAQQRLAKEGSVPSH